MKSSRINRVDSTLDFHWAFLWGEALGPAIFSLDIWIREGAIFSTSCHLGRGADFGMSFHHELSATQQLRTSEHWAGGSIENIQHWAGGSSENIWGDLNNWAGAQNKLRQSGVWKLKISSATWPSGGVLEAWNITIGCCEIVGQQGVISEEERALWRRCRRCLPGSRPEREIPAATCIPNCPGRPHLCALARSRCLARHWQPPRHTTTVLDKNCI